MKYVKIQGNLRSAGGRKIGGKAISFNTDSTVLYDPATGREFVETILPDAVDEELVAKSDIILNYNHDRGEVFARSNKGEGTLDIQIKEDGVYFETELPKTQAGDELLELVRRGDICYCSFAFTVSPENVDIDKSETPERRTIRKIDELFDLSCVVDPAYGDTFVEARKKMQKDKFIIMTKKTKKTRAEEQAMTIEELKELIATMIEESRECDPEEEETREDEEETTETVEETEETEEEREDEDEETEEREDEDEETTEERSASKRKNIVNNKKMRKMTLVQQIRSAVESNKPKFELSLDKRYSETVNTETTVGDTPDPYAVGTNGIATEYQSVIEPLYNSQVFKGLGIHMFTGAPRGDYQFPVLGKGTVGFAKEVATAVKSGNAVTSVHLSPKRITGYIDISKQLLLQDTVGINEGIRNDLYNAIADAI